MAPTKQRRRGHDRGGVLADVAVMLAGGGETISDIATLRNQPRVFGEVASTPTVWRALEAVDPAALDRIAAARAEARRRVWEAGADPGFYVIDIDATLVGSHSEKEGAAPTYKRGFGFHPLLARADSAGCSHGFVDRCVERNVRFVVGHRLSAEIAALAVTTAKRRWRPAVTADGSGLREHAEVVEITRQVDLTGWPAGTRMIVRREPCHPGAQLTFTDIDGHRYQVMITDLEDGDIAYLEALYRGRGRVEQRIADAKDTGLANFPSASFQINQAWLTLVLCAQDLLTWTQLLTLEGELARAEPKRLRYTLLHTAGLIVTTSRQRFLRLADDWPWTDELINAHTRLHNLPLRT